MSLLALPSLQAKEQCNGIEVDGRKIRVDYSITQRAHTPTPGVYMGKPTRSLCSHTTSLLCTFHCRILYIMIEALKSLVYLYCHTLMIEALKSCVSSLSYLDRSFKISRCLFSSNSLFAVIIIIQVILFVYRPSRDSYRDRYDDYDRDRYGNSLLVFHFPPK